MNTISFDPAETPQSVVRAARVLLSNVGEAETTYRKGGEKELADGLKTDRIVLMHAITGVNNATEQSNLRNVLNALSMSASAKSESVTVESTDAVIELKNVMGRVLNELERIGYSGKNKVIATITSRRSMCIDGGVLSDPVFDAP